MIVPEQDFQLIYTSVIVDRIKNTLHTKSFDNEKEAVKYCLYYIVDNSAVYSYEWQVIFGFPTASGSRSRSGSI
jgi:hypothetical protein